MSCDSSGTSNLLYTALLNGETFELPDFDINDTDFDLPVSDLSSLVPITNSSLTSPQGGGTFDVIVGSIKSLLEIEYRANRLNGAEYTRAFIALIEAALSNSVSYLLQRDAAFIQAEKAKVELAMSRIQATEGKVRLAIAKLQAKNQAIELATGKIKLALADVEYCTAKFNLENMLPKQVTLAESQIANTNSDTFNKLEQNQLIKEQVEAARGATLNTRRDGTTIVGTIGVEKALQVQQTKSFDLSSKLSGAKLFTDAWTVSKTADIGTPLPLAFNVDSLEVILGNIKTTHEIG